MPVAAPRIPNVHDLTEKMPPKKERRMPKDPWSCVARYIFLFFCPVSNYSFPDAAATEKKFRNILPGSRFPCCRGGKNILSNAKSRKEEEEGHDEKQIIPPPLPPPPLTNSRKKEGTKIRVDLFPLRHRFLLLSTHPPPPPPLSQLFEQRRRKCPKDIYSLEIASNVQAKEDMWIEEAASFFQIEFSSV